MYNQKQKQENKKNLDLLVLVVASMVQVLRQMLPAEV
jgi:hypothetical protein